MKLGLGTVRFGMPYGISNRLGQPDQGEVFKILQLAAERDTTFLDTAPAYGSAEVVLGNLLGDKHRFRIGTKVAKFGKKEFVQADGVALRTAFLTSLRHLKQTHIDTLLFHSVDELFYEGGHYLLQMATELVREGLVKKLGVSVYSPEEVERVLMCFRPDVVQLPLNVLDQRAHTGNTLVKLKREGIEVHTRSVFLQGLLLMDPSELHEQFEPIRELLTDYREELGNLGLSPLQAALGFLSQLDEVCLVLVGVSSANEFAEIYKALNSLPKTLPDYGRYACYQNNIINPSNWRMNA